MCRGVTVILWCPGSFLVAISAKHASCVGGGYAEASETTRCDGVAPIDPYRYIIASHCHEHTPADDDAIAD
jgi:hypothetical protein